MTHSNRGLELAAAGTLDASEIERFHAFYEQTLGHVHQGLDFWIENGPETLKRYRLFADLASPDTREMKAKLFVFGFLPWYAVTGYDVGVRYLLTIRQRLGLNRDQVLDGVRIAFLVIGPAGMETVARALRGFPWDGSSEPEPLPAGWSSDPSLLHSSLDFSRSAMTPAELRSLEDWYERTLGEVPPYVRLLGRQRPDLLKAYRGRYENCVKALPVQSVPLTLLHYDVIRGHPEGIRENLLLGRALGVSVELVLDIIFSALIMGGTAAAAIVERAAGDVLAAW